MQFTDTLRLETRHLHRQLDHHPILEALMSPSVTIHDYRATLDVLGAWFMAIESVFYPRWPSDLAIAVKMPPLQHDLRLLARQPVTLVPAALTQLPERPSDAFCLGVMYVCEGSSLGGAVIARHLEKRLQRRDVFQFYSCYGEDLGVHWHRIQRHLNQQAEDVCNAQQIIAGAKWAFNSLYQHLRRFSSEALTAC
ncbi:MAG: hypothetical protein RL336_1103 [Pseudomonadota bacterium]